MKKENDYYQQNFEQHGLSIQGSGWENVWRAIKRYETVASLIGEEACSVVDFGCGTAGLLHYLSNNVSYTGVDRFAPVISACRETHPDSRFIFGDAGAVPNCDICVAIGVFNLKFDFKDDDKYRLWFNEQVAKLYEKVGECLIINAFHRVVDTMDYKYYHDLNHIVELAQALHCNLEILVIPEVSKYEFFAIFQKK